MAVNKVVYNGETLIDLTSDTVEPGSLLNGVTAHDKAGNKITGSVVVPSKPVYETCAVAVELDNERNFECFISYMKLNGDGTIETWIERVATTTVHTIHAVKGFTIHVVVADSYFVVQGGIEPTAAGERISALSERPLPGGGSASYRIYETAPDSATFSLMTD